LGYVKKKKKKPLPEGGVGVGFKRKGFLYNEEYVCGACFE
jgi:hypothetical protein